MQLAMSASKPVSQSVSQGAGMGLPLERSSVLVCTKPTNAHPLGDAVRACLAGTRVSPPQATCSSPPPAFASHALHRASSSGTLVKRSSSGGGGTRLGKPLTCRTRHRRPPLRPQARARGSPSRPHLPAGRSWPRTRRSPECSAPPDGSKGARTWGQVSRGDTAAASVQSGGARQQTRRSPPKYTNRVAKQGLHQ